MTKPAIEAGTILRAEESSDQPMVLPKMPTPARASREDVSVTANEVPLDRQIAAR